ncbi:MAG TPA: hypothetical protein VJS92_11100 [Candidatus Polarisedimenticolaceae bacterium]|nr:hypothetical protein [Candidatus Polarisedimenticolaceae bacterium]
MAVVALLLVGAASTFVVHAQAQAGRTLTVTGKATAVDASAGTLAMKTDKGEDVTVQVDPQTKISKRGQAIKLDGVAAGDPVTVTYEKNDTSNRALAVTVTD